jgi:hypothetical protein
MITAYSYVAYDEQVHIVYTVYEERGNVDCSRRTHQSVTETNLQNLHSAVVHVKYFPLSCFFISTSTDKSETNHLMFYDL